MLIDEMDSPYFNTNVEIDVLEQCLEFCKENNMYPYEPACGQKGVE